MHASNVHLAVIGAGPFGLETAAWGKHRGYRVTVFERQSDVGGDWLRWGNPWSKLQSHRDGYLFSGPVHVPGEEQLPSYPSRQQMLEYFRAYTACAGIACDIKFNCTVTGRTDVRPTGTLDVHYIDETGTTQRLEVTHIFSAPGRVNRRREIRFPGEANFCGHVAWGSGEDLIGVPFAGKNVIIVGHGSFAIENARHALEEGAESVTLVCRHHQVVMSRIAGFLVDRHVDRNIPSRLVLEALSPAYGLLGYDHSSLENLFFSPSNAMFPTSDFYFLARASGKLTIVHGQVANVSGASVELDDGRVLPGADVLIKCFGFRHDGDFDDVMGADFKKGGRVAKFHFVDASFRIGRHSHFTGGASSYRFYAPCYEFIWRVEGLKTSDLAASKNLLRKRVASRSKSTLSIENFLLEQEDEWKHYCKLLDADIEYPYALDEVKELELRMEAEQCILDKRCGDHGVAFNNY